MFILYFEQVSDKYFAHPYHWIVLNLDENDLNKLNLTLLPDSNVILANYNDTQNQYELKQGETHKLFIYYP